MALDNDTPMPATLAMVLGFAVLVLLASLVDCSDPKSSPNVGSNTNWLTACEVNADCTGALGCYCGACSKGCARDSDCASFPGTACVSKAEEAASALCGGLANWSTQGICLPRCEPGGCGENLTCALFACVPMALPDSDFCSAVAGASIENRSREEELVLTVEQARNNGGIVCGNGSATAALSFVRVDPRLTCVARVLAQDIAATGTRSLTDSAGRNTTDRLGLAGYAARFWVEGYAWDSNSASSALQAMLADSDFCSGFSNGSVADIGVAFFANVYVVTLASE